MSQPVLLPQRSATIADCVHVASFATGIPVSSVLGRSRTAPVSRARQMAAWLARECTVASLPAIGRALNRDHTSILHSVRVAQDLIAHDKAFSVRALAARAALLEPRQTEAA